MTRRVEQPTKKGYCMKKTEKTITTQELQERFLAMAYRYAEETFLEPFREDAEEKYDSMPATVAADFFDYCDTFSGWKRAIEDGGILRVLRFLGVYDGRRVNRGRLLTALRVVCFIGLLCDDLDGPALAFGDGSLEVPFDEVIRLERFVRSAV